MHTFLRTSLLLCALLASACAPTLKIKQSEAFEPTSPPLRVEAADKWWWQLRFKLIWPEDEPVNFSLHALIAEQFLLPVLTAHQEEVTLWRFHRRAGRDSTGHQLSLVFFAGETTAHEISATIKTNPLALWLTEQKRIERIYLQKRSTEEVARLENTSDPEWPPEIQRSWPYFIMGVSQAWLLMVQEISAQEPLEESSEAHVLIEHYQRVDQELNTQWREYGQHAYLHHLNAIFGYQPIRIKSSLLRNF